MSASACDGLLLAAAALLVPAIAGPKTVLPSGQDQSATAERADVEPSSSLRSRVGPPDAAVIGLYLESGVVATPHRLTTDEWRRIERALAKLPKVHRDVLRHRLVRLSFVDAPAGAGNALTRQVRGGAEPLYDITLRAGILDETLSEFLTTKERTVFSADGSGLLSIRAEGDALLYVLLHETTHVVDNSLGLSRGLQAEVLRGIWSGRVDVLPALAAEPALATSFRRRPKIAISSAPKIYESLGRTPFPSLYATAAAPEYLAEIVAWRELSRRFARKPVVEIRDREGRMVYRRQLLKGPLVEQRLAGVDSLMLEIARTTAREVPARGPDQD